MKEMLVTRAAAAGIELSDLQVEQTVKYHEMLREANVRFNLTRVSEDAAEAIDRNYLDCMLPARRIRVLGVETAIDVGSGAGFPGIPLSICLPEVRFTLVDSLGKRVDFLNEVIAALGLNAQALHLRAEDGARKPDLREKFDLATARAVAPLNLLAEYLLPYVRLGGHMLALKGPTLDAELRDAERALSLLGGQFLRADPAPIPGRDWQHCLAWIEKIAPTPERYPRKPGKPEKAPL